jgi:serine/threonine protein kinase
LEGKYSPASDVWSFGVVLWELLTNGRLPYFDIPNNRDVIKEVLNGYRLPKPEGCTDEIYGMISSSYSNINSGDVVLLGRFYQRQTFFQRIRFYVRTTV